MNDILVFIGFFTLALGLFAHYQPLAAIVPGGILLLAGLYAHLRKPRGPQ